MTNHPINSIAAIKSAESDFCPKHKNRMLSVIGFCVDCGDFPLRYSSSERKDRIDYNLSKSAMKENKPSTRKSDEGKKVNGK